MSASLPQFYESVLHQVREKLQAHELTQAQVGKALGIKQSAVSYLLSGRTKLTLEQFLLLADLIGEKPYKLMADAEAKLTEVRPMPPEVEEVQLRSTLHLAAYVAACRPIRAEDLVTSFFPLAEAQRALADLTRVGLLEKKGETFEQAELNVTYVSATNAGRRRRFEIQQDLHRLCQQIWLRNIENKQFRARRFNYFNVAYLTNVQVKQVEELFWRAYERILALEKENAAAGYPASEHYQMWQTHMVLMTPFLER